MTRYLLDTGIITDLRKPKPPRAVVEWIATTGSEALFIPAIAIFELQAAIEQTPSAEQIERWLDNLCRLDHIISLDAPTLRLCAKLMAGRTGEHFVDATVAATALVHDLTVATRNVRDYAHFEVPVYNPATARR